MATLTHTVRARSLMGLVPVLVALAGCQDGEPEDPLSATPCDPLDPAMCALPYPSSFYLAEAQTETGVQVAWPQEALPVNEDGVALDPTLWNEKDGFPTSGPLLVGMGDLSLDGLVGHDDIEASLEDGAKTLLVDADRGKRIPHFVELDMSADQEDRLLLFWPVVPLEHGTRYVVGFRGLQHSDGSAVKPSPAFAALRDGMPSGEPGVEGRRAHFEGRVFPVLEDEGFARDELQLAWDFTTVSREGSVGRMEWIREDLLAYLDDEGPDYTISNVEDEDCDGSTDIGRTIHGRVTVPLYTEEDGPGTLLTRDGDGMPYANGETEAPFIIRIPCSLIEEPEPAMLVQYGHGMLGSRMESRQSHLGSLANEHAFVAFAVDWTGMKAEDAPVITLALLNDPSGFATVPERSHQGFAEQMAAMRLMKGPMVDDPHVSFPDGGGQEVSVIDPSRRAFYGISQGAIMGGAYVAMSPDLERAALTVGGMPYALLLHRSSNFEPFFQVLEGKYPDNRDITLLIALFQALWEPAEASGWAHLMNRDPTDVPAKDVLVQVALGDSQVSTLGGHIQARAYGAATVAPQTRPVYGIPEKTPPFQGNALVEWVYEGVPEEPYENLPPDSAYDTHRCVRNDPWARTQIMTFFETGTIVQPCDGICAGVCD